MTDYEIEPSVQMRLYTMNKRHFALVFIALFTCYAITIVIGITGPTIMEYTHQNTSTLTPVTTNLKTGPFLLKSPSVSTFHQQLWLSARLTIDKDDSSSIEQLFTMAVQIRGFVEESRTDVVYAGPPHNHTRTLHCDTTCDELAVLHLGYLAYPYYIITINFKGLEDLKYNVKSVQFTFASYSPSFTQLEIWFRFAYLVVTFIVTCVFAHSLKKFSLRDWSIEQKWMSALLPLLLLYNNPVFPLTFLVNSWIPGMFDAVFQTTFVGALLLFWLCLYHGVRQVKRKWLTFYGPKVVLVGSMWLAVVTVSTWQGFTELHDPTYNFRLDTSNILAFKVVFFTVGGLYLLYLVYLLVRAYAELRHMPYFDLRLKFMTVLMLLVLCITVTLAVVRFGVGDAFKDNLVAALAAHFHNSTEFVAFYGLLNLYMFTMAFVYSPSKNAIFESHFKDNPALSMLNDSDDDVVYGSDKEETAIMTRKTPPRGKYESDEEAFN